VQACRVGVRVSACLRACLDECPQSDGVGRFVVVGLKDTPVSIFILTYFSLVLLWEIIFFLYKINHYAF